MIIILGIDALDYEIVNEMNLKNLKQVDCKKLTIPVECFKEGLPFSPYCWESILTGKPTKINLGIYENVFKSKLVDWFRLKFGKYLKFIKGKRLLMEKIGFELDSADKEKVTLREVKTIFDLSSNTGDFGIINYSKGYVFNPFCRIEDDELRKQRMLEFAVSEFDLFRKWFRVMVKGRHDLIMGYMRVLDFYGHYLFGSSAYYEMYKQIDLFVKNLCENSEDTIIIISDHGMMKDEDLKGGDIGIHTDTAFFSINKLNSFEVNSILDMYPLVEHLLSERANEK